MVFDEFNFVFTYILVIDDDPDDHNLLRQAFHRQVPGSVIESVYDGEQAIKFLKVCTEMPSVIFLDMNMPKLPGDKTLQLIKDNESLKNVPVVVLTVSKSDEHKRLMLSLGASAFYTKPATFAEVEKIVMEVTQNFIWAK